MAALSGLDTTRLLKKLLVDNVMCLKFLQRDSVAACC